MKTKRVIVLVVLLVHCFMIQAQKSRNEFKEFLESEDEALAKKIVEANDGTYSLFCQAALQEDPNKKINLYSTFIEKHPELGLAKAYLNRGIEYNSIEKYDSAIVDCGKSIELDSKEPYAYFFRGASYASQENYEKANENYTTAIGMDQNFGLAYHMRGISFISLENYTDALSDLNKAVALNKDYPSSLVMRGLAYDRMGEYKKAIADWKGAKKMDKSNEKDMDELIEKAKAKMKDKK